MGKRTGKDRKRARRRWWTSSGWRKPAANATRLVEQADAAVARFGAPAETLRQAVRFVVEREV